jgi:hypothetical protein
MRSIGLLALLSGCSFYFSEPSPSPSPAPNTAGDDAWVRLALPVFEASCKEACHASGPLGFLGGADAQAIRETLLGWQPPVVDLAFPTMSPILTKGLHDGPELDAQQTSDVLIWMQHESSRP